ncbi:MAG: hypothetical protein IRY83_17875 [Chloroflexi bacterium]|nr:hypothetical protein [Chloroflexota bacterium]
MHGPRSGVEWFAAALGRLWNQRSVLVAHLNDPRGGNGYLLRVEVPGLSPQQGEQVADRIKDILPHGWHIGFDKNGGSLNIALPNADEAYARNIRSKLIRALEGDGYQVGTSRLDRSEIKFIGEEDYDRIIRGGPAGWHRTGP